MWHNTSTALLAISFMALGCQGRHRRASQPHLKILPPGRQEIRAGKNLVLTCKGQVPNKELVKDLRWIDPRGQEIPQDDRIYSEELLGEVATALFIKNLSSTDAGKYSCIATYPNNQKLISDVEVSIFVGITWENAPLSQYASLGDDYLVQCLVRANPPANIDWLKESVIISAGDQYKIEDGGLVIKGVTKKNSGTYTCRARVSQTGELEERNIKLEVQDSPSWVLQPSSVQGIENGTVKFMCQALGTPQPSYTWRDENDRDVSQKSGWEVDTATGSLTAKQLNRNDAGEYTCLASNNAGRLEASANLDVIIKPKIEQFENKTFPLGGNGMIICQASGDPLPKLSWKKVSKSSHPFVDGRQPGDERIVIEEHIIDAPKNAEGTKNWKQSTIAIGGVKRPDDGLYECQAENRGGKSMKFGHITVEFSPIFKEKKSSVEWSWDQRPRTMGCSATAIPNATLSWWFNGEKLGTKDSDRNYEVKTQKTVLDLTVTPLASKYYGIYMCRAENMYGVAEHGTELRQAHEPSVIQQAVLDKITATTLHFRFVSPTADGGLPVNSYAVEYKEVREEWRNSKRRVWQVAKNGQYILEDLSPKTTYDLRFGCKNSVGFSPWSKEQQITLPKRGKPEPPQLNAEQFGPPGIDSESEVIELKTSNSYEFSWQIPEDNGYPIDHFLLQYFPVRRNKTSSGNWACTGNITKKMIPRKGKLRDSLDLQFQDTFYKIILQAHNKIGLSSGSFVIIKTMKEQEKGGPVNSPQFLDSSNIQIYHSFNIKILLLALFLFVSTSL